MQNFIWPSTHLLQTVIDIDVFNAKSYPDIDLFITQIYMHWQIRSKSYTQIDAFRAHSSTRNEL